jgi:citrate lyase gamma subunit
MPSTPPLQSIAACDTAGPSPPHLRSTPGNAPSPARNLASHLANRVPRMRSTVLELFENEAVLSSEAAAAATTAAASGATMDLSTSENTSLTSATTAMSRRSRRGVQFNTPDAAGATTVKQALAAATIPILRRLRSRHSRAFTTAVARKECAYLSSSTREDRVGVLFDVVRNADATLTGSFGGVLGEGVRRADLINRALTQDPRAIAALDGTEVAGIDSPEAFRLALAGVYAMLLEANEECNAEVSFEVAYEFASQDWLEQLTGDASEASLEGRLAGPERQAAVAAFLRQLVRDIAAVGCATRRAAIKDADPAASDNDSCGLVDDVVRTLMVIVGMWQVSTGSLRRYNAMRSLVATQPLDVASRRPMQQQQQQQRAPSPARDQQPPVVPRNPDDLTIILRSKYTLQMGNGTRAVIVPDMLPSNVRESGVCLARKVALEAVAAKLGAATAIDSDVRQRAAAERRQANSWALDALRKTKHHVGALDQRSDARATAAPSTTRLDNSPQPPIFTPPPPSPVHSAAQPMQQPPPGPKPTNRSPVRGLKAAAAATSLDSVMLMRAKLANRDLGLVADTAVVDLPSPSKLKKARTPAPLTVSQLPRSRRGVASIQERLPPGGLRASSRTPVPKLQNVNSGAAEVFTFRHSSLGAPGSPNHHRDSFNLSGDDDAAPASGAPNALTTPSDVFKCKSSAMASFNRFVYHTDRVEHQRRSVRERLDTIQARHDKRKGDDQRALLRRANAPVG